MPKKIIKIGIDIPGDESKYTSLKSKLSLLDYDIAIVNPAIYEFYDYSYDDCLGKRCLSDTNSFRLKEHIEHWRREILEAIKAGNTVFLLLNEFDEVYVATGEQSYSGTGRNRQTTRHVAPFHNYQIIPGGIDVVNSNGTAMRLCEKDNILAVYWAEVGSESVFRVLVDGQGVRPLIKTKSGDKIVGAYLRFKNAPGALVLLPYLEFEREKFSYKKERKLYWTEEAIKIGKKFTKSIIGVDKALRKKSESTPIPNWAEQELYVLPKEKIIRNKLLTIEKNIETLQNERKKFEKTLTDEITLKNLLYESGKNLELSIIEALKLLGFDTSQYRDSNSEFDVVFESKEGRLLGEAEGKDNKPINIDKLRQLEMNIHEDFARDNVDEMAKGVLIGNAYRLLPPEERGDFFTQKCLTAANRSNTALIKSIDLFMVAKYLSGKKNKSFAKKCRQVILKATGIVVFPEFPDRCTMSEKVVIENNSEDT